MAELALPLHIGHAALDLAGVALALTSFVVAVVVAVVLDRRRNDERTSR